VEGMLEAGLEEVPGGERTMIASKETMGWSLEAFESEGDEEIDISGKFGKDGKI
ncbi:hypothetical protein Dimus_031878, partial [Dionaea muscipula]